MHGFYVIIYLVYQFGKDGLSDLKSLAGPIVWLLGSNGTGLKSPLSHACLEICSSGLYTWHGCFIGIESGFGPVDLGSIPGRDFGLNRAISLSKLCTIVLELIKLCIRLGSVNWHR